MTHPNYLKFTADATSDLPEIPEKARGNSRLFCCPLKYDNLNQKKPAELFRIGGRGVKAVFLFVVYPHGSFTNRTSTRLINSISLIKSQ